MAMHPRLPGFLKLLIPLSAVLILAASGWPAARAQAPYDLILRQGRVADGTGQPLQIADVAIAQGRIARIGRVTGPAKREIDAQGCVIAPGFIDVHTHAENIESFPKAENFARMGVTTLILGNCGGSELDLDKFFRRLDDITVSCNVASLLGHGTIRGKVMGGSFLRPPTPAELDRMKAMVDQGMRAGALGLSTGLIYLPGTFAKTEELIELARVAAAHDGIYVSHMRDEGDKIFESLEEVFRIAREAGIRADVSHIKLSGKPNWGRAREVLAAMAKAREEGLRITQDMYVYPASSTGLSQLVPTEAREGGLFSQRMADPAEKSRVVAEMKSTLQKGQRANYDYAMIAYYKPDPTLNGLNVVEAARKKLGSDSLDNQIELILDIHAQGGASSVFHSMSKDDLRVYLADPHTMIGADSSVREFNKGVPHPRGYGNNARVLARYTRELGLLSLEDAVRRMTALPAATFQIRDRGQVREGFWADLVVFDPDRVGDPATFESPHRYATGFRAVIVNGELVVEKDRHTQARPGRILRHQPWEAPRHDLLPR